MGYSDKTAQTVTAHFTKRGRETLANALSGNTTGDYIITKFALGDDEIDYGLWDETQSSNLEGRIVDNMPLLESFINEQEIMNYFLVDTPPMPARAPVLSNLLSVIELAGLGDSIEVKPITDNWPTDPQTGKGEKYTFYLGHDNLVDMYQPWSPPVASFGTVKLDEGTPDPGSPPLASFNINFY
jgi:hypothetical protein